MYCCQKCRWALLRLEVQLRVARHIDPSNPKRLPSCSQPPAPGTWKCIENYPRVILTRSCLPLGLNFHRFIFQACISGLRYRFIFQVYTPSLYFRFHAPGLYSRFRFRVLWWSRLIFLVLHSWCCIPGLCAWLICQVYNQGSYFMFIFQVCTLSLASFREPMTLKLQPRLNETICAKRNPWKNHRPNVKVQHAKM